MNFKDPSGFLGGLVRPFVTVALVGAVIYLGVSGSIGADKVYEITLITVGFWFGSRPSAPPEGGGR